ncbi:DUF4339 domain-containing protein [Sorangium sp. So ce1036]|uniref:DUF4339 domain-containing protein n=1 Tax=Sorangium sp. So ce1036 TaxID=3133328 RepID=UPI003F0EBC31
MRSVKLFRELLSSGCGFTDRWYVSNGEQSVGPVTLDQLARGIECGRVPLDSFVRNEAWTVWCPLSDIAMVTVAGSAPPAGPLDEASAAGDGDTGAPPPQAVASARHGHASMVRSAGRPGAAHG